VKDKLNLPPWKSLLSSLDTSIVPVEVISAAISVWIWANFKEKFENISAKNDQIDFNPECAWILNAAIDESTRNLVARRSEISRFTSQTKQDSNALNSKKNCYTNHYCNDCYSKFVTEFKL